LAGSVRTDEELSGKEFSSYLVPDVDLAPTGKDLAAEMEAEWVKDWSDI
jgi:hypothetical protein